MRTFHDDLGAAIGRNLTNKSGQTGPSWENRGLPPRVAAAVNQDAGALINCLENELVSGSECDWRRAAAASKTRRQRDERQIANAGCKTLHNAVASRPPVMDDSSSSTHARGVCGSCAPRRVGSQRNEANATCSRESLGQPSRDGHKIRRNTPQAFCLCPPFFVERPPQLHTSS